MSDDLKEIFSRLMLLEARVATLEGYLPSSVKGVGRQCKACGQFTLFAIASRPIEQPPFVGWKDVMYRCDTCEWEDTQREP